MKKLDIRSVLIGVLASEDGFVEVN